MNEDIFGRKTNKTLNVVRLYNYFKYDLQKNELFHRKIRIGNLKIILRLGLVIQKHCSTSTRQHPCNVWTHWDRYLKFYECPLVKENDFWRLQSFKGTNVRSFLNPVYRKFPEVMSSYLTSQWEKSGEHGKKIQRQAKCILLMTSGSKWRSNNKPFY